MLSRRWLLATLLLLGACPARRPAPPVAEKSQPLPPVLPQPLPPVSVEVPPLPAGAGAELLPLYDDRPEHLWNRVHQALFDQRHAVERAKCLVQGTPSCARLDAPYAALIDLQKGVTRYEEASTLLISSEVAFLLEPTRFQATRALLRAAAAVPANKNPLAAALFQHDLWERFDALDFALHNAQAAAKNGSAETSDPLRLLRDEIGTLIRAVALPKSTLSQLPSNRQALVQAYPQLLSGLDEKSGPWLEVATRSREMPNGFDSPVHEGTRHAMMAGFRAAFRRFVRVPDSAGGADFLRQGLRNEPGTLALPVGAQMIIFEVPLVVSQEGEIMALPLIDLIEARVAAAPSGQVISLPALELHVLEARRALLRRAGFPQGGLFDLPYDAPFPVGGACSPNPLMLVPMRSVCVMCHGQTGERLTGTLSHGEQKLRVSDDADLQVQTSIRAKLLRPDFAALKSFFAR